MSGVASWLRARRDGARGKPLAKALKDIYDFYSVPFVAVFLLGDPTIRKEYGLTWRRKLRLVLRMYRNTRRVQTGTSYRAHVAMAAKILAVPKKTEGVIVECGAWKGGTTANMSIIADIAGRRLVVYDSFEGLPEPATGDRWATGFDTGAFRGELDEVRGNVARYGVLECCEFRKGWFKETLPHHAEPVIAMFLDVDFQDSLHDCVLHLWPHLTPRGWLFVDEYTRLDFCALFFSERWWAAYFDRPPPGLMGAGTGIGVGQYFTGPHRNAAPLHRPSSVGLTRKDFYGMWDFVPEGSDIELPYSADGWTTTAVSTAERVSRLFEQAANAEETPGPKKSAPRDNSSPATDNTT